MGSLRQFQRILTMCLFISGAMAHPVHAEIVNDNDVYSGFEVCDAYLDFLSSDGDFPKQNLGDCHRLAAFLLEHHTPHVVDFIEELGEFSGEDSSLGAMARTFWSVMFVDALRSYLWSEVAVRRVSIKMASSGDLERAAFYSFLLSEIQRMAVQAMCSDDFDCDQFDEISMSVSEFVGDEFRSLEQSRADLLLLCLLKTDAYQTPIRNVLRSPRYMSCIAHLDGKS